MTISYLSRLLLNDLLWLKREKNNCYSLKGKTHNKKIKCTCFKYRHLSANMDENFKVQIVYLRLEGIYS